MRLVVSTSETGRPDADLGTVGPVYAADHAANAIVRVYAHTAGVCLSVQTAGSSQSGSYSTMIAKVVSTASGLSILTGTQGSWAQPASSWAGFGRSEWGFSHLLASNHPHWKRDCAETIVYTLTVP